MSVALRRADRHAGSNGDLLERVTKRVFQQHDLRLLRRDAGERSAQLAAELRVTGVARSTALRTSVEEFVHRGFVATDGCRDAALDGVPAREMDVDRHADWAAVWSD